MSIYQLYFFLCASPVTTFLMLRHCLHHCVASLFYGDSDGRDLCTICWSFRALPDSISTCDVNRGYYMLLLFLFILLLFVYFISLFYYLLVFFIYFRDNNMISISTVEFRYCVVIIILVKLGKPWTIKG